MDSVIFLGTKKSGSSREAIIKAKNLGYHTIVLTDNERQIQDRNSYPEIDSMLKCDFSEIDKIKEIINYLVIWQIDVRAIVSFIDPFCSVAAKLSNDYKLSNFSYDAMEKMQNKLLCREVLKNSIYNPKYKVLDKNNFDDYTGISRMLPVVIKYIESNGSKDVYLSNDLESYKQYVNRLFNQYKNCIILVEEFLDGKQYIVEAVAFNNKITIEAIIEQEIKFINDHFIITGYSLGIDYPDPFYNKLKRAVVEILELHHFENGPCHLEMRYVKGEWKLVEINPRISGAGMNQFLEIGLGYSLVEEHLKLSLNLSPNFKPRHEINTFAEYVILDREGILERITGRTQVMRSEGIKYIYIKPRKGTYLTTPTSLGNRYAFVIATGESKDIAMNNAKQAASKIKFHLR
jgi:biotin carboxylase